MLEKAAHTQSRIMPAWQGVRAAAQGVEPAEAQGSSSAGRGSPVSAGQGSPGQDGAMGVRPATSPRRTARSPGAASGAPPAAPPPPSTKTRQSPRHWGRPPPVGWVQAGMYVRRLFNRQQSRGGSGSSGGGSGDSSLRLQELRWLPSRVASLVLNLIHLLASFSCGPFQGVVRWCPPSHPLLAC